MPSFCHKNELGNSASFYEILGLCQIMSSIKTLKLKSETSGKSLTFRKLMLYG